MIRKLREVKPTKRRKQKYIVTRRLSKKDKHRLTKPYITKLGKELRNNQIGKTPRTQLISLKGGDNSK